MDHPRRVANPKVLLSLAGLVLFGTSAIAIYVAAGCSPDSQSGGGPAITTSTTAPAR